MRLLLPLLLLFSLATAAADFAKDNELLHQVVDLALLGNGMLKGKALADFIARSEKLLQ